MSKLKEKFYVMIRFRLGGQSWFRLSSNEYDTYAEAMAEIEGSEFKPDCEYRIDKVFLQLAE